MHRLHHRWSEEIQADEPDLVEEINQTHEQRGRLHQRRQPCALDMVRARAAGGVAFENVGFGGGQPGGAFRAIWEHEVKDHAEHDGRKPFDQEQPLPTGQPQEPVELQQSAAQRVADDQPQ